MERHPAAVVTVVDGNNVIGAVPDGWWRDRPAAVRRLVARLVRYQARTGAEIVLVLDVPQPDLPAGRHDGIEVRYPGRSGRNAGDTRILELLDGELRGWKVEVVTSDRALARGAEAAGATVVGARTFLRRLGEAPTG